MVPSWKWELRENSPQWHLHHPIFAHVQNCQGVKTGVKVTQGQTIGYVGSTGLANGPHLCYRFWKNGHQVDAMKVELPPSEPIAEDNKSSYDSVMIDMLGRLHQIEIGQEDFPVLAGD